jgi:hypothetical protein
MIRTVALALVVAAANTSWAGTVSTYGMTDTVSAGTQTLHTFRADVRVSHATSQFTIPLALVFGATEEIEVGVGSGMLLGPGTGGLFAPSLGSVAPWAKFGFPLSKKTQLSVMVGVGIATARGAASTFGAELLLSHALSFGALDLNVGYGNDHRLESSLAHASLATTWTLTSQWSLVGEVFLNHAFSRGAQLGERVGVVFIAGTIVAIDASVALTQDFPARTIGISPQLGVAFSF